jgi:fibronectin type 3 domain-containing protein
LQGDRVVSVLVESPPKTDGGKFSRKGVMHQPRLVIEPEKTAAYPAAPNGLKVTSTEEGLRIDWDDSAEADVKSYTLYRTPVADKDLPVFAAGLVDSHFVDKLVKPGVEYTYWVTATDTGTRESAASAKVAHSR